MFLACSSFNTLYQFWIHTRTIDKLGSFEWVFNTPSHHRVHHGCDAKYIDRNYGGTLIVWDRLFGSFQQEEEEPVYGITKPLADWNPVWANFHYYADSWPSPAGHRIGGRSSKCGSSHRPGPPHHLVGGQYRRRL